MADLVRYGPRGRHLLGRDRAAPDRVSARNTPAVPGCEEGLSWTTSFDRGHWFATRLGAIAGQPQHIYELDTPREWVLASFDQTRNEHEYLIDLTRGEAPELVEVLPEEWEYRLAAERDDQ